MIIRRAEINDIDSILPLEEQIFKIHSKERPDWIDKNKRPFSYDLLKNIIESNTQKIFIAEMDNKIIGFCKINHREINNNLMFYDMLNIEIENLIVDEKHRKKGIGKNLFGEVKNYAKEVNAKYIELSVWEFNKNAINFYKRMGMKIRINRMEYKV
jgi:ribosomal protein S18 acetylase RimI-like enzyme